MSKQSIEWHQQGLANMRRYLLERQEQAQREVADVERLGKSCVMLQHQIDVALIQGKDGFDAEKFLKQKKQQ